MKERTALIIGCSGVAVAAIIAIGVIAARRAERAGMHRGAIDQYVGMQVITLVVETAVRG